MFRSFCLSLIFGGIAVFSYAPYHIWPLSFVSFIALLGFIANKTKKQALLLGFAWAFGYFASGVNWVYISIKQYGDLPTALALIILALLVVYLSLYPMLFALILRACNRLAPAFSFKQLVLLAPILWQITEFLRGYIMNGFAWLQLGYSQLDSPLNAYFPLVGIDGVNLMTTSICGLALYGFHSLKYAQVKKPFFGAAIALLVLFIAPFQFKNISWTEQDQTRTVNISLVQANIPQSLKWSREQLENTIATYSSLTQKNLAKSDIIIWSEASITDDELDQQPFLHSLDNKARAKNTEIAVGIIDYRPLDVFERNANIYNTLLVLGAKKPYQYPSPNRYQKHHLVPFGEFTPLQWLLNPLSALLDIPMSSMTPGPEQQPQLLMKNFKFTTAICYEVILSNLMHKNFKPDTDFLLTVSNDAWFGDSIGPWQHLQMAQARALEFGRPLIRSTNNGITAIIDAKGQIINQLPQFKAAVLTQKLSPTTGLTPYAKWGDKTYFTALFLMISFLFIKKRS